MGSEVYVVAAFLLGAATALFAVAWRGRAVRGASPSSGGAGGGERVERRSSPRGVRASSLSVLRDAITTGELADARERELADDLRGYLGDVAALHNATDAMLWVRESPSAPINPIAWNHAGAPPVDLWGTEQQRALIAWANPTQYRQHRWPMRDHLVPGHSTATALIEIAGESF